MAPAVVAASVLSQQFRQLAVEFLTVPVFVVDVGAVRVEDAEGPAEIPSGLRLVSRAQEYGNGSGLRGYSGIPIETFFKRVSEWITSIPDSVPIPLSLKPP